MKISRPRRPTVGCLPVVVSRKIYHYSNVIMTTMASQIIDVPIVGSTVCLGTYQRKHQISAPLAFVRASNALHVSIWWWCYHVFYAVSNVKRMPIFLTYRVGVVSQILIAVTSHGHHGVSDHWPLWRLFNTVFGLTAKKHQGCTLPVVPHTKGQ